MDEKKNLFEEYELKQLAEKNIDLKSEGYRENPEFIKLYDEYISDNGRFVKAAWWVEEHLVGQERLEQLYGPYDLRIHRKLTMDEKKESALFNVLSDKFEEKKRVPKDIWRYFYRDEGEECDSKAGLFERMKAIGFDWSKFQENDERIRLMYFLYCFENENKVKIGAFLGTPTLENVDDLCVGLEHKNSKLMSTLKRGVAMDLNPEYQRMVNNMLVAIATHWENQIRKIIAYLDFSINDSYLETMKRIAFQLNGCVKMIGDINELKYEESILESFYLKLAQHESLGRENDILDINLSCIPDDSVVTFHPEVFESLAYQPIEKNQIYFYLKENKKMLLPYVYEKEDVTSYEEKRYDNVLDNLKNYLDMVEMNTKAIESEVVPKLYAVMYMQEFLNIDKKEKISNRYYRYKTGELKSLNTELALGEEARIKSQLAITRKVTRRMYKYAAKSEIAKAAFEAELCIDKILIHIYQCNNFRDMCLVHNFFMNLTDAIFLSDKQLESTFRYLNKTIKRKKAGYEWLIQDNNKLRYFLGTIHNSHLVENLGKLIGKEIQRVELKRQSEGIYWPIELTENYIGIADNYKLEVFIDVIEKKINMLDFYIDPNEELKETLIRNSLM